MEDPERRRTARDSRVRLGRTPGRFRSHFGRRGVDVGRADRGTQGETSETGEGETDSSGCSTPPCWDDPDAVCGDGCCTGTEVCTFETCVVPGAPCRDPFDCAPNEYCDYGLGQSEPGDEPAACAAGGQLPMGACFPKPPACPEGVEPDPFNPQCISRCEFVPEFAGVEPKLVYAWGAFGTVDTFEHDVRNTPIVIQLDDHDCGGALCAKKFEATLPENLL